MCVRVCVVGVMDRRTVRGGAGSSVPESDDWEYCGHSGRVWGKLAGLTGGPGFSYRVGLSVVGGRRGVGWAGGRGGAATWIVGSDCV